MHRLPPEEYAKKKQLEIKEKLIYYYGPRDDSFKKIIKDFLLNGNLKEKYLDLLLTPESMELYGKAFTSNTIHSHLDTVENKVVEDVESTDNYEMYEKLGDGVFQNFIVFYAFRYIKEDIRVSQVKVIATIKSKYGSREQFSPIAEKLGFWDYISASVYKRTHSKKALQEDVLEAIIGVTSLILDEKLRYGVGYAICYDILTNIFNKYIVIETEFEELQDFVSKLNEFSNKYKQYNFKYDFLKGDRLTITDIYRIMPDNSLVKFATGSAANKANSKQAAAVQALNNLKKMGLL
jgi:dsRNA-specific ribonuclease